MTFYIDTSALIRLLQADHPDHEALVDYFDRHLVWDDVSSSELLRVEVHRVAVRDAAPQLAQAAEELMEDMLLLAIDRNVVKLACGIPHRAKSLDAIHIASCILLAVETVITYDANMIKVLEQYGIRTVSPVTRNPEPDDGGAPLS